jgi:hypothetical protein
MQNQSRTHLQNKHSTIGGIAIMFLLSPIKLLRKCTTRTGLCIAVGFAALGSHANAAVYPTANLLTNPGFENSALTPITSVLGSPFSTGVWGYEASTIVTATGGVIPSGGTHMLSMTTDFNTDTQTLQSVDVSAYATDINAGLLTANFGALFNVSGNVPAAVAGIFLQFYDSSHNFVGATNISSSLNLDASANTWQPISLTNIPVPVNTNYLLAQVLYNDASLQNVNGTLDAGYVDDAVLTMDRSTTPEPGALMALLPVGAMMLIRRRRQIVIAGRTDLSATELASQFGL